MGHKFLIILCFKYGIAGFAPKCEFGAFLVVKQTSTLWRNTSKTRQTQCGHWSVLAHRNRLVKDFARIVLFTDLVLHLNSIPRFRTKSLSSFEIFDQCSVFDSILSCCISVSNPPKKDSLIKNKHSKHKSNKKTKRYTHGQKCWTIWGLKRWKLHHFFLHQSSSPCCSLGTS